VHVKQNIGSLVKISFKIAQWNTHRGPIHQSS